jgi:selenocysteine-specific elongation factor
MRNIIVGTAGHIDHGKTSLVKALTGIDADRLAEEKRRGITIDLGFAHMRLADDLRIGFIDVPGHERFVRNMLAGAGGIDLVLFVVAADESIKPQTREHFEICRMLAVKQGVIAITKADLVDPELLELVKLEIDEFTAGSFLENAPKIAVSATTGQGLEDLRSALTTAARAVEEKNAIGWARLPIDRAFTMKGFGTVATGTLISGTLATETEVELLPEHRRLRVRGLQVYGEPARRARAGERTAVNLVDIDPAEIRRGMVLADPGRFNAVTRIDCRVDLLDSAKPLKNRAPVHFHIGAAEVEAEVRFLDKRPALKGGESAFARVAFAEPVLALPGDRFIIRKFSPVTTIGGGVVADISGKRYRAGEDFVERIETLLNGTAAARVELLAAERPFGMEQGTMIALTGLREIPATANLEKAGTWLIPGPRVSELAALLRAKITEFHKRNPLQPGIPKAELKASAMAAASNAVFEHALAATTEAVQESEVVRLRSHRIVLREDEHQARGMIESAFESAGLTAPAIGEVLKSCPLEPTRAKSILQMLLKDGRLIRIHADLVLHASAVAGLRSQLADRRGQRFSVPEFKEWTGVSRKYAIPLLEYLDREHITVRHGDFRVVS